MMVLVGAVQCRGEGSVPALLQPPRGSNTALQSLALPPRGAHSAAGSPAGGRPGQPPAGGRYIILDRSNHWSDYILLVITVVITAVAASSCVAMAW